jgi:AcrR family transcriptional regulator
VIQLAGQSQKKLDRLLEKAEELFFKYGYNGVSVDQIALEAGISKMTIYKYFHTKEDLFVEVIGDNIKKQLEEARRLMDEKYHTLDKIEALYSYSMDAARKYPHILLKDIIERKSFLERTTELKKEIALPLWKHILEDGISKGEIRNMDVGFVSGLLMNMPNAIKNLDFLDNEEEMVKFYKNFIDFLKYGLLGGLEK